jgi:hypothetical protein
MNVSARSCTPCAPAGLFPIRLDQLIEVARVAIEAQEMAQ